MDREDPSDQADLHDVMQKFALTDRILDALRQLDEGVLSDSSGDRTFDREVRRSAASLRSDLLRLQSLLADRAGLLKIEMVPFADDAPGSQAAEHRDTAEVISIETARLQSSGDRRVASRSKA